MIRALQEGLIKMTASNWPTCFYEDGIYDPENKAKGLFHGHTTFQFYTHLFIGPSAAATNTIISNTSKMLKNCAWGLTKVTPSIIAYAHVMLYFTLSTAPHWCSNVSLMDLSEMTWRILEMFKDQDDWTRDTLTWWNSYEFILASHSLN
ncbi:hypothetical protein J3R82DRAFT_9422 [Butyriboletus roseoflavus]|nr:hypothetical protein J3R82DRAFT_9422 [Butyriboletus roseoflavus]